MSTTDITDVAARRGLDGTSVLTIYICLLLAIPSVLIVKPLGSAGSPSTLFAFGAFFLWVWFLIRRSRNDPSGPQPVRAAALAWLVIMLAVYAHAMLTVVPGDEISPADNGLVKLAGLTGILLVANDGIINSVRHRTLVRRLVIGAGIVAALGLFQYATKQVWVDRIQIPGLTSTSGESTLATRSGLARPSGTSTHPIEYGVVLTMMLPLATVFAMHSPTRRWLYRGIVLAVAFAVFLSISRSALVCAAVGMIVLAVSWTAATRLRALAAVVALSAVVYLTVPGVLGTLIRLFTSAADDPSIISRTSSYDLALTFIERSPLLGRGFGTFLPKYWILDNGYLGLAIEGGILGLIGLLVVIVMAAWSARQAHVLARKEFDRALAQGLLAAVAAGACSLAFFDSFGFPQSAGCLALLLGLAGAARRLARAQDEDAADVPLLVPSPAGSWRVSPSARYRVLSRPDRSVRPRPDQLEEIRDSPS